MSGHSKWSKVKHQKKTTDAIKSQAFTRASRALTVAVREGGGITDPEKNFRLRLAIEKAHDVNMPKDTIERAIARGSDDQGAAYEQIVYEGYGPGGVAMLVEAATDNRQRTSSNIKFLFDRAGGALAQPGAVSFQFTRLGVVVVAGDQKAYDDMLDAAIAAGADDVVEVGELYEVYTQPEAVMAIKTALEAQGWKIDNWEIIMRPTTPAVSDPETVQKNEELVEKLEELEDVQQVFSTLAA